MLEQVKQALRAVKIEPKDEATAELARHYAGLIDNAAPAAKYADAVRWLDGLQVSQANERHRSLLVVALSEHSSASDFGPKLLAALTALGMTPAAAGTVATPVNTGPKSPLDELRERRAAKQA